MSAMRKPALQALPWRVILYRAVTEPGQASISLAHTQGVPVRFKTEQLARAWQKAKQQTAHPHETYAVIETRDLPQVGLKDDGKR